MNDKQQNEWVSTNLSSMAFRLKRLSKEKRMEFFEGMCKLMNKEWTEMLHRECENRFQQYLEGK